MTNRYDTVLYTGVTNNLLIRTLTHKTALNPESFTAKYNISKLVYYELFDNPTDAIKREKQIKAGSRQKKIDLIQKLNPEWKDLYQDLFK